MAPRLNGRRGRKYRFELVPQIRKPMSPSAIRKPANVSEAHTIAERLKPELTVLSCPVSQAPPERDASSLRLRTSQAHTKKVISNQLAVLKDERTEPLVLDTVPGTPNREFLFFSQYFPDFPRETSNLKNYYLLDVSKYNVWSKCSTHGYYISTNKLYFEASKM